MPAAGRTRRLLALVALSAAGTGASGTGASAQTIRGVLLEDGTYRPIDLGSLTLLDASGDTVASGLSDERGLFSLTAPDGGSFRLVARALGYRSAGHGPYEVGDGDLRVLEVTLEPAPVPIEGVDVEAEALFGEETRYLEVQGFYWRRKMGFGHFLGPEDLAREVPLVTYTEDLLERVPGVFGGVRVRSTMGGLCNPAVFVDGVRQGSLALRRLGLDGVAPLAALEAVEVYTRGSQVPLAYQWAVDRCGVILFWTKH